MMSSFPVTKKFDLFEYFIRIGAESVQGGKRGRGNQKTKVHIQIKQFLNIKQSNLGHLNLFFVMHVPTPPPKLTFFLFLLTLTYNCLELQ